MSKQRAFGFAILGILLACGVLIYGRARDAPAPAPGSAAPVALAPAAGPARRPSAPHAAIAVAVRGDRGPLAGAAVRLAPAEDGDEDEVVLLTTGADGVARASMLAPGAWSISASATGYEPAALPPHTLLADREARVALALIAGGEVLRGTVTDVSGGPIGGARVEAARVVGIGPEAATATAVTSADGRYQLAVPAGLARVTALSADYAAQSRLVAVGAGGATADFALVPGGAIEGVVLDEATRQPAAGAAVTAAQERGGARRGATSGPGGRFRITGLRPGVYELTASTEGRWTRDAAVVGLGVAEQVASVDLLVSAGPVIRGAVLDEQRAPVPGVTVVAVGPGGGRSTPTDARGAFSIEGLAPGSYALMPRGEDLVPVDLPRVELADRDVGDVAVIVRRGIELVGRVEPPQVADVSFEPARERAGSVLRVAAPQRSGADGRFRLRGLDAGAGRVVARGLAGDRGAVAVTVAAGMPEVVVPIEPGAAIAGRVLDGKGEGVSGVTVIATPLAGGDRTVIVNGVPISGVRALTGVGGAYELRGLEAGEHRVTATDVGRRAVLRGDGPKVTVAARERRTGVDLTLDRADGVIRGVVTGPDGKPLADAWVSAHQDLAALLASRTGGGGAPGPPPGRRPSGATSEGRMLTVHSTERGARGEVPLSAPPVLTDAQGRFELRGLERAPYEVIAEGAAGALRGRAAAVVPDATVALRATGLSTVAGTVRGPRGPVALFTVELEGPTRAQRSFTGGAFQLGRVEPGAYTVRVRSRDGNAEAAVKVAPGAPTTVDLALVANAVVTGVAIDETGAPLAGVPVAVVDQSGSEVRIVLDGPPAVTGPDGRFRVERAAGRVALLLLTSPRPVTRPGLVLEPGQTLDVGQVRVEPPAPRGGPPPGPGPAQLAPPGAGA
jgi:hypothetical protein